MLKETTLHNIQEIAMNVYCSEVEHDLNLFKEHKITRDTLLARNTESRRKLRNFFK